MSEQDNKDQLQDTFLKSRNGAIVRCASIMMNLKRKDLAMQILQATNIDRQRFEELKAENKA